MSVSLIAPRSRRPVLITGGAGFIGTNLVHRLLQAGRHVRIYDNLSRAGAEKNLRWLRAVHGSRLQFHRGDVRNAADIRAALADVGTVFHLAAQVAVTTSLADPREDFSVNAGGLLKEIRQASRPIGLVFTSTNKVYGALEDIRITALSARYQPACSLCAVPQ